MFAAALTFLVSSIALTGSQMGELLEEKQTRDTIHKAKEAKKYGEIYYDERGINLGTLLRRGVKPSELVAYDQNFNKEDGVLLNKYDKAVKAFLDANPEGIPICATLVATGHISTSECAKVESLQAKFIQPSENGVSIPVSEEMAERLYYTIRGSEFGENNNSISVDTTVLPAGKTYKERKERITKKTKESIENYIKSKDFAFAANEAARLAYVEPGNSAQWLSYISNSMIAYENAGNTIEADDKEYTGKTLLKGVARVGATKETELTKITTAVKEVTLNIYSTSLDETVEQVAKEIVETKDEVERAEFESLLKQKIQNRFSEL